MTKRVVSAGIAVFVLWSVLDFVIHGLLLRSAYEATAQLWRPQGEMKMVLMYLTILIAALVFAFIYARFFAERGSRTGVLYGLLFGLATGVTMGYGTYSVMPIPHFMALTWFLGTLVEGTLGGLLVGVIVGEAAPPPGQVVTEPEPAEAKVSGGEAAAGGTSEGEPAV